MHDRELPHAPAPPVPRRPYEPPVLKRYGDLAQLTQQKGMGGRDPDGALVHNNKTR